MLIDVDEGAYGVVFPDIPGFGAMGGTLDETLLNAKSALLDYTIEAERDGEELTPPSSVRSIEVPAGNKVVSIPLASHPAEAFALD